MQIYPFQAKYPNFDFIASPDSFFGSLREEYITYYEAGFFKELKEDALFIYQIKTRKTNHYGLMVCTDIEEYDKGNILKHENTISSKEQKIIQLLIHRKASVKPVLLTYPSVHEIQAMIQLYMLENDPFFETYFEQEDQKHLIWKIVNTTFIEKIQALFNTHVNACYIADGHHRISTMSLLNKRLKSKTNQGVYNRLLIALFGSDQLEIHEYNRVIEGLNELSGAHFMANLSRLFKIEHLSEAQHPQKKHEIILFLHREWYKLTWKPKVIKKYEEKNNTKIVLDITLLNEKVFNKILNIKNIRSDSRINYVEGKKGLNGLIEACLQNDNRIGFYLYPIQLAELMKMADDQQLLPPKSTYFEPRMKSGLLIKDLSQ